MRSTPNPNKGTQQADVSYGTITYKLARFVEKSYCACVKALPMLFQYNSVKLPTSDSPTISPLCLRHQKSALLFRRALLRSSGTSVKARKTPSASGMRVVQVVEAQQSRRREARILRRRASCAFRRCSSSSFLQQSGRFHTTFIRSTLCSLAEGCAVRRMSCFDTVR